MENHKCFYSNCWKSPSLTFKVLLCVGGNDLSYHLKYNSSPISVSEAMSCMNNLVNVLEGKQIEVGFIKVFPREVSKSTIACFNEQILKKYGQRFIAFPRDVKLNASSLRAGDNVHYSEEVYSKCFRVIINKMPNKL